MKKNEKSIYDKVSDGLNYFKMGFLEELTTDKRYYVEAFIEYIERVEGFKRKEGFQEQMYAKNTFIRQMYAN